MLADVWDSTGGSGIPSISAILTAPASTGAYSKETRSAPAQVMVLTSCWKPPT
jgi:hypothetical protein